MLAAASKADAGIEAPPFGPIAESVLIVRVESVGCPCEQLDAFGDVVGYARAGQPIGIQRDSAEREAFKVRVDPVARVGERNAIGETPYVAVCRY